MTIFLPQKIRKRIEQNEPLVWLINLSAVLFCMFLFHVLAYRWIEAVSWEEALWVTWATFSTVGYGDFSAQSLSGRFISVLFGTTGIAVLGTLFATVFETMQYRKNQRRFGFMSNPIKNGYVLFHYPGETTLRMFLREIYAVEGNVGVCVVDERIESLASGLRQEYGKRLHFIRGSSLDRDTYEKANIAQNKAVIVFPRDPASGDTDGNTDTVVKLVLSFVTEATRVLYMLVDPKNGWLFDKRAVPILQDLEILAMVQECQDQGAAMMVERLLLNTKGANPQSVKPSRTAGLTWQELQLRISQGSIRANLLALIRDGEPELCPEPATVLTTGDILLIATFDDDSWHDIEAEIAAKSD